MAITVSVEIYQDELDYFRWKFLDSKGELHGPSGIFASCSDARADIDKILAASLDKS